MIENSKLSATIDVNMKIKSSCIVLAVSCLLKVSLSKLTFRIGNVIYNKMNLSEYKTLSIKEL